ncbi:MAG: 30S ribosome-binding factor RbfA [Oscillospiraceae bacterium]|nr:30S ribosome-binding factor RbfA [Oscillospiraceae bacterium]
MASYKNARAAEDVRRELSDIIRGLKDPRITGMLSIVGLELSGDYSHCKVYISSMEGLPAAREAVRGLVSASGLIRREIGKRLTLRKTPEFHFEADGGIEHSASLGKKMKAPGFLRPEGAGEITLTEEADD